MPSPADYERRHTVSCLVSASSAALLRSPSLPAARSYDVAAEDLREVEVIFEPQDGGGYSVDAPDLSGLHNEGHTFDEAAANAEETVAL